MLILTHSKVQKAVGQKLNERQKTENSEENTISGDEAEGDKTRQRWRSASFYQ
jgi:hypothetical protein